MDQDYTGKETLEFLKDAVNYNRYLENELVDFIAPYGEAVDFGAGNGEFARRLRARGKHITCVEADANLRAEIAAQGLHAVADISALTSQQRIFSQNVLEHIEDDEAALRSLYAALASGGRLFLYVPAFMSLYTHFDKSIGHYRRYTKQALTGKLLRAGFTIERAEYVDAIGFLCWIVMGKFSGKQTQLNPKLIKLFDRLVFPLSRILDNATRQWFGKNLLVVASKP